MDSFQRCTKRFEKICENSNKKVNLIHVNMFLDGIVRSDLSNGNIIVKKALKERCPNIKKTIADLLANAPITDRQFIDNYASLLKLIGMLQFFPYSFFEKQFRFINSNLEYFNVHMLQGGLQTLLRLVIKINI